MDKIKVIIYAIAAYLGVDVETGAILIGLMSIDSFVGGIRAIRMNEGFTFRKMLWGFISKLSFLIIPLVLALLGNSLGYDFHYVVSVTLSILTVAEVYSIIGNIYSAKNLIKVQKIDAVSLLLVNIRRLLKKLLINLLNLINK